MTYVKLHFSHFWKYWASVYCTTRCLQRFFSASSCIQCGPKCRYTLTVNLNLLNSTLRMLMHVVDSGRFALRGRGSWWQKNYFRFIRLNEWEVLQRSIGFGVNVQRPAQSPDFAHIFVFMLVRRIAKSDC